MYNKYSILIIEDELELAKSYISFLEQSEYDIFHAKNFQESKKYLDNNNFDLVLLDLGLPDGNGLNLVSKIKNDECSTGLIIISAKDELEMKIKALEMGADDYLTKPFFFTELNARIKSLFRRLNTIEDKVTFNEITLYPKKMTVFINNIEVEFTAKEFDLLLYFISNIDRVISKTTLGEFLSSNYQDFGFSDDLVYTYIKNLKKKLSDFGSPEYIKNIYGVGYKFNSR